MKNGKWYPVPNYSGAAAFVILFLLLTSASLAAGAKPAEGAGLGGSGEAILIAEIALLLFVGRGLGEWMQRFGQPAVIGQLLAGLILGPSLFGWLMPAAHHAIFPDTPAQKSLIAGISNVGVMLLLLLTGMETDLKLARKVGRPAVLVAAAGVAVPFLCGFALGWFLPMSLLPDPQHRLVAALFLGTALSISSIKIVAMIVREMNFMRRNLGQIIVASAIMEDTTGWVIISITLAVAGIGGESTAALAKPLIGTAAFLVLSYTFGRRWVYRLIRFVNDNFVSEYAVVTAILIVMCVLALITQAIGVNTVLGAFVAGVLVGGSPILTQHIQDQLRGLITAFMMPIFFGLSGLSANLTILANPEIALLTIGLVAIASVGKFGGAFLGGIASGLTKRESLALGCAMNARGSTEVIVASIGLGMGMLTHNLYTMIVTMAVITTMSMPPLLRWSLARLPMRTEERQRLEREGIDARGFVSRFERLLIAADDSANGRLATRIAGYIAGHRGLPITVLHVPEKHSGAEAEQKTAELAAVATEGAKEGHRSTRQTPDEGKPDRVEVLARAETAQVHEAVTKEGRKGYDLLFVGVEKMRNADGTFTRNVDKAAAGFDGAIALVIAGRVGADSGDAASRPIARILVPVTGTEPSRRGAELAFALAPAESASVTALRVAERLATRSQLGRRRAEKSLIKDLSTLAERYGHKNIATPIRTGEAPDAAILAEAERGRADMIVIGAAKRTGEALYLGQTVANVLGKWDGAIVLLAT
ncbi:MAG TPA: cation:proton antiporter [Rhizomicrobium sp.]|jgi:Kef-type K+ transport system membrane component KefB/nucleotide-binding universal stress UspA family protein|nr:cation:proton antiporter [Rhizomicrobium sp.]